MSQWFPFFPHTPPKNPHSSTFGPSPAPNSWRSNHGHSDGPLEKSLDHHPTRKSWEKELPCFSNLKQRRVQGSVFPIAWSTKDTYLWSFTYKHLILNGTSLTVYHKLLKTKRKQHCRSLSTSKVDPSLKPELTMLPSCWHTFIHPPDYNTYAHLRK